ncbi:hypothetical protein SUDANB105_06929 [Streptomyces sp. enrichment culture]
MAELTDLRSAVSYHPRSRELAREAGSTVIEQVALCNTGRALLGLGEPARALRSFREALGVMASGTAHWNAERETRLSQAQALRALGRPDDAREACTARSPAGDVPRGSVRMLQLMPRNPAHALECRPHRALPPVPWSPLGPLVPSRMTNGQSLGFPDWASTSSAASSSVSTQGGEPARGSLAVSLMHRTATTPTTAAAMA